MNLLALRVLRLVFLTLSDVFLIALPSIAQIPPQKEPDIGQLMQVVFPFVPEETNPEEVFEYFFQLLNEPLDVNHVTGDELAGLLLLSDSQVQAFLAYRNATGDFLSLYELQSIPEWDLELIRHILPFFTLNNRRQALGEAFKNPTQHFLVTRMRRVIQEQKGFSAIDPESRSTTRYAGNPWNWYGRYRYARSGVFSVGATFEKDAGEVWNWTPSRQAYGIDFTSFHVQVQNRGRLKNLVLGDYQLQVGQGLVLASGFSLGKGAEVIRTTYRNSMGIRPYTSVTEHGFFRGIGATYEVSKNWDLTLFYSHKHRDGTVAARGKHFNSEVITSFPTDGYHRTDNERSKHGNVLESNIGSFVGFKPKKIPFEGGVSWLTTRYSLPVEKRDLPYNRYEFRGRRNTIVGLHASYRFRNTHLFTEMARSGEGGAGKVLGAISALSKKWDLTVLIRNYARNFHSFYGNAFREGAGMSNEQGVYGGIRYSLGKKWQYSAYVDYFRFPSKKYLVDTTSAGYGVLLNVNWRPTKTVKLHSVFRAEQKQRNNRGTGISAVPLADIRRTNAAINFEWKPSLKWELRTRWQGGSYLFAEERPSRGLVITQDATLSLKKLVLSARVALIRTDDYDSRQYVAEKDLLYSFSIPAYYDRGHRYYLMARYDITRSLRFWIRWSSTKYRDLEIIGSGLNEISGNERSELKFQLMYRF